MNKSNPSGVLLVAPDGTEHVLFIEAIVHKEMIPVNYKRGIHTCYPFAFMPKAMALKKYPNMHLGKI